MTTSIGLIVTVTLLVAGGVVLLRGSKSKGLDRWPRILLTSFVLIILFFLLWLAIMVFAVGPSMRGMQRITGVAHEIIEENISIDNAHSVA
jgi:hypothetical protein